MTESFTKRRRQAYSKLICTGCRTRRIRCALPDVTIQPSSKPQPANKACQRCRNHGLDCIVDFTTLGRPAQKRSRAVDQPTNTSEQQQQQDATKSTLEDSTALDVGDFILTQNEPADDDVPDYIPARPPRLSRRELSDTMNNSYNLLAAMLSRDKLFASAIGSQPLIEAPILDLIDEATAAILDEHLVWHKVHYPAIPCLPRLREEIHAAVVALPQLIPGLFLFTLLCDLALDVPSPRLAALRSLQPALRALVYHNGQKLFFSLARDPYTVLALALVTEYRPLSLTSSQVASTETLKALPQLIMEKYVATELGYSTAGSRLLAALEDPAMDDNETKPLMSQCGDWIHLNLLEDLQNGIFGEWARRIDRSAIECLDALRSAAESRRMPVDMLYPYSALLYNAQALANVRDMTEHWKDLRHLEEVINGHRIFCDREGETLQHIIQQTCQNSDFAAAISHLADMECHRSHVIVVGAAMFFSIMAGAHAATHTGAIQVEQAMAVSDNIIKQLLAHEEDDPNRPEYREFLEKHGTDRMDQLERCLTNFITAADTLLLNGIPYIAGMRDTVGRITVVCKDIVESNAARLKGWGGLDDRVDVQMILFSECARRLEGMSASAGTDEALAKGCLLTAAAKLIRSLHRILQGFKKKVGALSKAAASSSETTSVSNLVPTPSEEGRLSVAAASTSASASSGWDDGFGDDVLSDWSNWPQMDSLDFSEILGGMSDFGGNSAGAL